MGYVAVDLENAVTAGLQGTGGVAVVGIEDGAPSHCFNQASADQPHTRAGCVICIVVDRGVEYVTR